MLSFGDFVRSRKDTLPTDFSCYHHQTEISVDRVYKFEKMEKSLAEIKERVGLPEKLCLPQAKSRFRASRAYAAHYGTEERLIVAEQFRREIEYFGYEFES